VYLHSFVHVFFVYTLYLYKIYQNCTDLLVYIVTISGAMFSIDVCT